MKLLLLEDSKQDQEIFEDTVEEYNDELLEEGNSIEVVTVKSIEEAKQAYDSSFEGVVIDLNLGRGEENGSTFVESLDNLKSRVPVAIFTGTPVDEFSEIENVELYIKGETKVEEILIYFKEMKSCGITSILGNSGLIEQSLKKVFSKSVLPLRKKWIKYDESYDTEKAILRVVVSSLLQLVDDDCDLFPEEFYVKPFETGIKPGSLVVKKDDKSVFVVLNPSCDLVIRSNGKPKVNCYLLVKVCGYQDEYGKVFADKNASSKKAQKKLLEKMHKNTYSDYYHFLPPSEVFDGGFVDFRELVPEKIDDFGEDYDINDVMISPLFCTELATRFARFYGRQGQPDLNLKVLAPLP